MSNRIHAIIRDVFISAYGTRNNPSRIRSDKKEKDSLQGYCTTERRVVIRFSHTGTQCTPSDYNEWARVLCHEKEYEKALPYMEKCLSLASEDNLQPSFLDTYGDILFGLGRLVESKEAFNRCLAMTIETDERRCLHETTEKIRMKFYQS